MRLQSLTRSGQQHTQLVRSRIAVVNRHIQRGRNIFNALTFLPHFNESLIARAGLATLVNSNLSFRHNPSTFQKKQMMNY
jgi:hypothetical protein